MAKYFVDPDISKAKTLTADFYTALRYLSYVKKKYLHQHGQLLAVKI